MTKNVTTLGIDESSARRLKKNSFMRFLLRRASSPATSRNSSPYFYGRMEGAGMGGTGGGESRNTRREKKARRQPATASHYCEYTESPARDRRASEKDARLAIRIERAGTDRKQRKASIGSRADVKVQETVISGISSDDNRLTRNRELLSRKCEPACRNTSDLEGRDAR